MSAPLPPGVVEAQDAVLVAHVRLIRARLKEKEAMVAYKETQDATSAANQAYARACLAMDQAVLHELTSR